MADEILYAVDDNSAIVTINRPEKRNALNHAARQGLFAAIRAAEADESVRTVIITGAGDKAFCAGADLTEMAATGTRTPGKDFTPRFRKNIEVTKPVIAAVNGAALAGGFLLAQMCDLCVACDDATFGISEAKWSRGAPWASALSRMVPQRIMLELLLTAAPISAARMHQVGFVNLVASRETFMDEARALAAVIGENAPLTVAGHLKMTYLGAEMGVSAAEEAADAIFEPVYNSADAQEGPAAFREGRPATWTGR